jgi:hypothetical protein
MSDQSCLTGLRQRSQLKVRSPRLPAHTCAGGHSRESSDENAAIAAQDGRQGCERFLRAPLVAEVNPFVPRQRHWNVIGQLSLQCR